jgi:O-antigen ligase
LCSFDWRNTIFFLEDFKESILKPHNVIYHFEAWEQTLERIKDAPFFGEGISADRTFIMTDGTKLNHPHNVYLSTALYGGLTGLFLFLILQSLVLWEGFLRFKRRNDFTYVAILLFGFLCIITMNHRVISHPNELWMYLWLFLGLLAGKRLSMKRAVKSFYQNVDQTKHKE